MQGPVIGVLTWMKIEFEPALRLPTNELNYLHILRSRVDKIETERRTQLYPLIFLGTKQGGNFELRFFVYDHELMTLVQADQFLCLERFKLCYLSWIVRVIHRVHLQNAIVSVGNGDAQLLALVLLLARTLPRQSAAVWHLDVPRVQSHFLAQDFLPVDVSDGPGSLLLATVPPFHHARIDRANLFLLIFKLAGRVNDHGRCARVFEHQFDIFVGLVVLIFRTFLVEWLLVECT